MLSTTRVLFTEHAIDRHRERVDPSPDLTNEEVLEKLTSIWRKAKVLSKSQRQRAELVWKGRRSVHELSRLGEMLTAWYRDNEYISLIGVWLDTGLFQVRTVMKLQIPTRKEYQQMVEAEIEQAPAEKRYGHSPGISVSDVLEAYDQHDLDEKAVAEMLEEEDRNLQSLATQRLYDAVDDLLAKKGLL